MATNGTPETPSTNEQLATAGPDADSASQMMQPYEVPAISSGLAGLVLEHSLQRGHVIEIPSLGIRIGGAQDSETPAEEPQHE